MTNKEPEIRINVDLGALQKDSVTAINQASAMVAFGLDATNDHEPDRLSLRGSPIELDLDNFSEIAAREFPAWIVNIGLRELVRIHTDFLIKSCLVGGVIHRSRHTNYEWSSIEFRRSLSNKFLPDLLNILESKINTRPNTSLRKHIESLNRARRVFEHRHGILEPIDTDSNDQLVVSWRKNEIWVVGEDGDAQIQKLPTQAIKGASSVELRRVDTEQIFEVGDSIIFDSTDFIDIGLTFVAHTADIVEVLTRELKSLPFSREV